MNGPKTLAAALAQVRGTPAAEKPQPPANLPEALVAVRGPRPVTEVSTPPKAAGRIAEGDGLPGLRAFLEERRHGRS
ncbi:hypothetical protein [Xanthobacter autotrophicus]|uniref:hypothetical protein n=1 Tax=Xanthobacter autotrophicus TaxID=280 RepID=UPI0024A71AC5|nr:hypothetical protein [Xanthobacter autotrophicus]MDI4656018.1 hypothetical protein [Xanthobacter autotrophicus]